MYWDLDPWGRVQTQVYDATVPEFEHPRLDVLLADARERVDVSGDLEVPTALAKLFAQAKGALADLPVQAMEVQAQEILIRDNVSLRANLTALWQVTASCTVTWSIEFGETTRFAAHCGGECRAECRNGRHGR